MILLVLQVLFVLPHTTTGSIKVAESYWILKPNELVVDEDMAKYGSKVQVPLMCGEAFEGQDIIWRRESGEKLQERGNRILVTVEERRGGRYTCYSTDDSYLNHTLVLVRWPYKKIIKEIPEKGYVHCSTNNYSGSFQCSWTWDEKRAGKVVLIKAVRSYSGGNVSCSLNSSGQSITCQDHEYCPYAEELEHINLTIYFRSNYVVETYYLRFQISDIVRPDMVRVKRKNNTLELQYPDTWNIPISYFRLTFQVKEIRCGRKSDCNCSTRKSSKVNLIQDQHWPLKKGVTVCVRAQDDLCNSPWSEWTQYKCTKEKNKKRTRKNKKKRPQKEE
ncbi:interleukin 12Ba [Colossoma macropomum]|uniref:interleukin 12Ba n=1 Tax=Colossoma macropomum TaxID=42526 RepID=UPI001863F244|nr:interleukin 12Ba [Colossoma macropomum]